MSDEDHELAGKIESRAIPPVLTDTEMREILGDFPIRLKTGQRITLPNAVRYERVWENRWERVP